MIIKSWSIKPKNRFSKWVKTITCGESDIVLGSDGCGAELEINVQDIYLEKKLMPEKGMMSIMAFTMCPCCANQIPIHLDDLPKGYMPKDKNEWLEERKHAIAAQIVSLHTEDRRTIINELKTDFGLKENFLKDIE